MLNHKRLAQLSIGFVVLIFISQTYLVVRLFQVNSTFLGKVVNTITQDAYTKDMNHRLGSKSANAQPRMAVFDYDDTEGDTTKAYNVDAMKGVDKSSMVSIINIGIEMYLANKNPIRLSAIDSLAAKLLDKENIHADFYTQIVDLKNDSVLERSKSVPPLSNSKWISIQSKDIPLNFMQDKVLQLVLLNPLKAVFSQMVGFLLLSLLLCLFCIYCLFVLQRTLARQKKLAQSKNDFYNQVSHEMKKPVSVVYQALDSLLNSRAIENPERRTRYMELSMSELERMNSKIDMILTMSMVEEGMFKLNRTEYNLADTLNVLKERYSIGAAKPLEIVIKDESSSPMVFADKEHVFQCLSNLVENAIKYSNERVHIAITLFSEEDSTCISVRDNGLGMHEKDLDRIFEKFERIESDKKTQGYGIGLSYVRHIMNLHGGRVTVKSKLGEWSEFVLWFPKK